MPGTRHGVEVDAAIHERAVNLISTQADARSPERPAGAYAACVASHPARCGFDGATRAFQALVTALDRVTGSDLPECQEAAGAWHRAHNGAVRTREKRLRARPGALLPGGPARLSYNLLMTGLWSTPHDAPSEFGCVSATPSL